MLINKINQLKMTIDKGAFDYLRLTRKEFPSFIMMGCISATQLTFKKIIIIIIQIYIKRSSGFEDFTETFPLFGTRKSEKEEQGER